MKSSKSNHSKDRPVARIEVERMNAYQAPLEGRRNLLRLDFNENTLGPSPNVYKALQNIPCDHISIYPEYYGIKEELIKNLSTKIPNINLKIEQIGIFNGADAAIHATFHAYGNKGDYLLTTTPTFGYYSPCAQMQGMQTIEIPYKLSAFEFPLEEITKNLIDKKPKLLVICNPNNPTGTRLAAENIINLAKCSPETLVVVDELYEAFTGDSILPLVDFKTMPNILIIRSLSKTAGLAGLRVGFALGNEATINMIQRVTGPYDVNSFAVTATIAALKDQKYIDNYVSEVLKAKNWIKNKLSKSTAKYHIEGGNYFLVWPTIQLKSLESKLRQEGILIRSMAGKNLIDNSIRISIGTRSQMEQFWSIFNKYQK